jgi:hypothetical protein
MRPWFSLDLRRSRRVSPDPVPGRTRGGRPRCRVPTDRSPRQMTLRRMLAAAHTTAQTPQILVRAEPVRISKPPSRVQSRAEVLAEPLATIARDYVSFLQHRAAADTAGERCYVVVQTERSARRDVGSASAATVQEAVGACDSTRRHSGDMARRLAARASDKTANSDAPGLRTQL